MQAYNEQVENELMDMVITNYGLESFTPGLERTLKLYQKFMQKFKHQKTKIITIGGTNGKGQTAHTLTSLFNHAEKNVALWTSPHILSLRERFVFGSEGNLQEVTYEELKETIYSSHLELQSELVDFKISFYEFLFFVFLKLAAARNVDFLILEIGLGGRLDAVNHFDADFAIITSISRDHLAILGGRYELILNEKLGIARPGKALLTAFSLEYLNERVSKKAKAEGIKWINKAHDLTGKSYFVANQEMALHAYNYFCAEHLKMDDLAKIDLPLYKGRREIMTFLGKSLIFIGAHNVDGIRKMLESFSTQELKIDPASLLISFSKRPLDEIITMLKSLTDHFKDREIVITEFVHPKALERSQLELAMNSVANGNLKFVNNWKEVLTENNNKSILVCGSYYFIGEVQRFIHTH